MALSMSSFWALGREFHFLLESEVDHIQGILRAGQFYELEELELVADYAKSPKRILDIGSNIGNHTVFFAHRFDPDRLVPVEANPGIVQLLKANLGMNWHRSMDLEFVGVGLSDRPGQGSCHVASPHNIGGARLIQDGIGNIPIYRGDDMFQNDAFDLIKIDVEGTELQVLEGMKSLLQRSSGVVFMEVLLPLIDPAISIMRSHGYRYETSYQRYGRCINLLFLK
jgi:FkbM family methyltransferase